ncbi:MAG: amidohydrolase, partial [Boseongicola sp.]
MNRWIPRFSVYLFGFSLFASAVVAQEGPVTVYTAKKIITMEPSIPEAKAVAVADGRIVSVGTLESMQSWIKTKNAKIDRRFANKVLMPGFIDPHVHPSLPAVLTQFAYLAPDDWSLPTGEFPGAKSPEDYISKLKKLVAAYFADPKHDPTVPFVAWGYHQLWHGEIFRPKLDELFPDKAVIIWHRSFHELILNSSAIKLLGIAEAEVKGHHEIDFAKGHFWELGGEIVVAKMSRFVFAPDRYGQGMRNFVRMLHEAGVTTALDMGIGVLGAPVDEINLVRSAMEETKAPSRIILTPQITYFEKIKATPEQALKTVKEWTAGSTKNVLFDNHFKVFMDGAAFSGLGQMDFPGYMDGHKGVWMLPLDTTRKYAEVFWNAGFQLHAHTNGDKSAAALIDMIASLHEKKPRFGHRTILEHFMYAKEDQLQRMKELGISVSANPYYQYLLSDIYADKWLGADRARNMVPLGSAVRAGMRFALHSDNPMGPLSPLTLAATAVNRTTINGNQNLKTQRISVDQALRAITIDAAWVLRWEDRIGSIRAGKIADFAVLDQDPYEVEPAKIKDIVVWG